jgi:O-antigen/teichoic acid export membrane protein
VPGCRGDRYDQPVSPATTDPLDTSSVAETAADSAGPSRPRRKIDTRGRSLRAFAARGVLINTVFDVGVSSLNLVRGFAMAALISTTDYGVWGVLVISLGVLARLKMVGISDKYIQQEEADQELAFQKAFTLEVLISVAAMIPILLALPVIALIYGQWDLVAPGVLLITMLLADALQSPIWVHFRSMNFLRQRTLSSYEPVVGFVVAIGLGIAGAGYWALAVGMVVGAWVGAIVTMVKSPYPLRWRYDRGSMKMYASFSGPIFLATAATVLLANGTAIAVNAHLGLAAVGAMALAGNITAFASRVDDLVSSTLYPAVCAMQDRLDLLRESFVKSNRLALMWAMPFGVGLGLFTPELVHFVIGEKWHDAVRLLQVTGVVAGISHIGFNWDDYFRARAQTRPVAVYAVLGSAAMLAAGIPLLLTHGLTGLAIGIAFGGVVQLVIRSWYLAQLFDGFRFVSHAARAVLPSVPALAIVLVIRALAPGNDSAGMAAAQLAAYLVVTILATWRLERSLLREAVGYLTGGTRRIA